MTSIEGQQGQAKRGLRAFTRIVVLAMVVAAAGSIALAGVLAVQSNPSALASTCTITIDAGDVEVLATGSDTWDPIESGSILRTGTRVRTTATSVALLTFFSGSTLKLEPNTDVLVEQMEFAENGLAVIAVRQWIGTTWSRVVEMTNPGSRYEIRTPSAIGLVRGTYFMVRVDEAGVTTINVIEGEVTVTGQVEDTQAPEDRAYEEEREVPVPAGYQVNVPPESAPSLPVEMPADDSRHVVGAGADSGRDTRPASDFSSPAPSPFGPPTIATPTPAPTCSAYAVYQGHPGENALVEVYGETGNATALLGGTVSIDYELQYMGPLGPILARPIVLITGPESRIVRTWTMADDGSLNPNRDSIEPYPISNGRRFSLHIRWDLTDDLGQGVPAGAYEIQVTIETPHADGSGRFHILDSATPNRSSVVVQE